jgi:hypothetical protein
MSSIATLLTENLGLSLGECARQARQRLTLAAPYIKRNALERLLAQVPPTVTLTVFTRWTVGDILAGASDLSVFDLVQERSGSRLLLHPRLHAKVLLVDDQLAAIGSANVSDAALGFSDPPNAEVMAILQPVPNRLFLFLLQLEREAVAAREELRQKFEEAVKAAPPALPRPTIEVGGQASQGTPPLFSSFRNPEQLYRGYLSVVEFNDPDTRAAILDDLAALSLTDGLDEATFRQRAGAALLKVDLIQTFDAFVRQARYFREMAEWLRNRGVLADQGQDERKMYLQTLVRWLRHFLPGRYRLEEPNYSELFGRVEGWEE